MFVCDKFNFVWEENVYKIIITMSTIFTRKNVTQSP